MAIRKVEKVGQKKKVYVKPIYEKIEILEKTSLQCHGGMSAINAVNGLKADDQVCEIGIGSS